MMSPRKTAPSPPVEFLLIRGFLGPDLRFHPMMSRSTLNPRPQARTPGPTYFVELRNDDGRVLDREPLAVFQPVTCANLESSLNLIQGRIALHPGASRLCFFKEDILIDQHPVSDPPRLKIAWREKSVDRRRRYALGLDCSKPLPGAFLQVIYQWDARAYRTIAIVQPGRNVPIRFGRLPGGKACRLMVAYTSGMRTVRAVTKPFEVPERAPGLEILSPREGTVFGPGPVTLTGQVHGLDGREVHDEDLVWYAGNGVVGEGRVATVSGLPPGEHRIAFGWKGARRPRRGRMIAITRGKSRLAGGRKGPAKPFGPGRGRYEE